ncbi:MAG: PBECR3 domain-containing polyvalent protein [Bacillota bacterium]
MKAFPSPSPAGTERQQVGYLTGQSIDLVALYGIGPRPIWIGPSNVEHMRNEHPGDFRRFFAYIPLILQEPHFMSARPSTGSIEYVRVFNEPQQAVLVAVRASRSGVLYVRSLYAISWGKLFSYLRSGVMKRCR